jgi:hypothetical protein
VSLEVRYVPVPAPIPVTPAGLALDLALPETCERYLVLFLADFMARRGDGEPAGVGPDPRRSREEKDQAEKELIAEIRASYKARRIGVMEAR